VIEHYTKVKDWRWGPEFSPSEFACKDGSIRVVPEFMDKLLSLRRELGKPMVITSGYRTPAYNAEISSTGDRGPHTTGRAVDIAASGAKAFNIVSLAKKHGFTGIGLKQNGPHSGRFIHLDDLTDGFPRPWTWTY